MFSEKYSLTPMLLRYGFHRNEKNLSSRNEIVLRRYHDLIGTDYFVITYLDKL